MVPGLALTSCHLGRRALGFSGILARGSAVDEDTDIQDDGAGLLETYELPDVGCSDWGAEAVLDEGWDE
jgi:hypothetical protein